MVAEETDKRPHQVTKNARYSTGEKVVHSDDLHQYVTHAAIVNIPLKADEPLLLRRLQDAHWVFPRETPDVLSLCVGKVNALLDSWRLIIDQPNLILS
jgi:hypothetical protein